MIALGYFRGIVKVLDSIEAETPECAPFVAQLRDLARQFQLDAMSAVLRKARPLTPTLSPSGGEGEPPPRPLAGEGRGEGR